MRLVGPGLMFSDQGHKEPDILSVMCYVARLARKSASAFFPSLAGKKFQTILESGLVFLHCICLLLTQADIAALV